MHENACAIKISNLVKQFGNVTALDGIDLELKEGEFLTIFGPNGAGKTTLIRILASLCRPTFGSAKVLGSDVTEDRTEIRRKIGVISHQTFLYDNLTALENLTFYARMYDLKSPKSSIEQALNEVGLFGRRHDLAGTFSRGMQQRLSIARAILHDPKILLLDEPYTGLDQHAAQRLKEILLAHRSGRAIVLTTHNLARGLEMCDRAAIQVNGKIVYQKNIREIDSGSFEETYFQHVGAEHKWD
jgi:heme exporter protein A